MKRTIFAITTVFAAGSAVTASPMTCDGLTPEALGLEGVTFTQVAAVAAGEESPVEQCRIRATMAERTGADGKDYALNFELALPDNWNGSYVHQFNGGNDGEVKPATGAMPAGTGDKSPLARGYAVVSSDAGHNGKANPEAGLAGGARFGFDFEARQMYGYKAVPTLDPVARKVVETFYGAQIDKSYGIGCSNGGRHAMVAAVRTAEAFDGLLIGAPGYKLPLNAIQNTYSAQALASVTGDLSTAFSRDDLNLVADEILRSCDGLDGIEDGLVQDTPACQKAFDIEGLQCRDGQNSACLSEAQVIALKINQNGNALGQDPIYSTFLWDTGIAGGNWRFWKLESPIPPWKMKPIIGVMGASSVAQIFTTPPTRVAGSPEDLEAFQQGFDVAGNKDKVFATTEEFPESAMEVMAPPDYDNPVLSEFRNAGGKMIVFHGISDPVFSARDTAAWYAKLDANNGDAAESFAKFYPVPGMNHCSGGPTTDGFDLFAELENWVSSGKAPEEVIAVAREVNNEVPAALFGAERLLCPMPSIARFKGGDPNSAASFACE